MNGDHELKVGDQVWFPWNEPGLREVKAFKVLPTLGNLDNGEMYAIFHEDTMFVNGVRSENPWMFWLPKEVPGILEMPQPVSLILWSEENDRWEYQPWAA